MHLRGLHGCIYDLWGLHGCIYVGYMSAFMWVTWMHLWGLLGCIYGVTCVHFGGYMGAFMEVTAQIAHR